MTSDMSDSTNRTAKIRVYEDGQERGWLGGNQRWWFDPAFPHSFSIFDLDSLYDNNYFRVDHVGQDVVKQYVDYVLAFGEKLLGRPVVSILEAGCAGGWFTEELFRRNIDVTAVEGTRVGYDKTIARGVPASRVIRHDLRLPLALGRQFDMALCTEVAEHIECPFSSQLVQNLVNHSQLVWFSFEEPGTNDAHYHHSNEQPAPFWINLFRFYGYRTWRLPDEVTRATEMRGRMIFCGPQVTTSLAEDLPVVAGSGLGTVGPQLAPAPPSPLWKRVARNVLPPGLITLARWLRG
jgi:hypothetical protein